MSDSKARLREELNHSIRRRADLERDVVFLFQALLDIAEEHPDVELPDLSNDRFSESTWRAVR